MEIPLKCSLCGYQSTQKKYKWEDTNSHFDKAVQIWCPRNECKEKFNRIIPKGYICHTWYEYMGWQTIEFPTKEEREAVKRAKLIRDKGLNEILGR